MINKLLPFFQTRKYFSLKSQGKSMLPLLQPDDVLYFKKVSFHKIKLNDFLIVRKGYRIFTHRVIYKTNNYLITKGDNNLISDGKVYPHQIFGKVYQIKRNGKMINPEDLYLIQSSLYFAEIIKIKKALEKNNINFVFLKGLPLHLYFEKSHPRRIYADCDIIISKNKINQVNSILNKFGYKKISPSLSKLHDIFRKKITETQFYKAINNFPVIFDVHLEIDWMSPQLGRLDAFYPQFFIDTITNKFLNEQKSINIQNEIFSILSTENLILYLALHFFHHNFRGEYRLEFLAKIIAKNKGSNWPNIAEIIKNYNLKNFVYPVFLFLEKYYSVYLPKNFMNSIQPNESIRKYVSNNILNINIFDGEARITAGITRFKNLFYLSPNPIYKKLLIFLNPAVIYSILWVFIKRIKNTKFASPIS